MTFSEVLNFNMHFILRFIYLEQIANKMGCKISKTKDDVIISIALQNNRNTGAFPPKFNEDACEDSIKECSSIHQVEFPKPMGSIEPSMFKMLQDIKEVRSFSLSPRNY